MRCPYCNKEHPSGEKFCDSCGTPLQAQEVKRQQRRSASETPPPMVQCRHCGEMHPAHIFYCPNTGGKLAETTAPPSARPTSAPSAKLILAGNDEIRISETTTTLGRRDFFRVAPADSLAYISRQHLLISFDGGTYYIEDRASKNGTWLNSDYITGKGKQNLKDGDIIDISNVAIVTFKVY